MLLTRSRVAAWAGCADASVQYYDPAMMKRGSVSNQLDPAILTYDFEDKNAWEPFITDPMRADGKPQAFYTPRQVSPKLPKDRLRTMELQIAAEIKSQIGMARGPLPTSINMMKDLVIQLERALQYQETIKCNPADEEGRQASKDYERWKAEMRTLTPPKSRFQGRALNFAYSEAKRIRKHLLDKVAYATSREDGLEFLVAVKCFGYHGGVVSVWVYYALLDKPDSADD